MHSEFFRYVQKSLQDKDFHLRFRQSMVINNTIMEGMLINKKTYFYTNATLEVFHSVLKSHEFITQKGFDIHTTFKGLLLGFQLSQGNYDYFHTLCLEEINKKYIPLYEFYLFEIL